MLSLRNIRIERSAQFDKCIGIITNANYVLMYLYLKHFNEKCSLLEKQADSKCTQINPDCNTHRGGVFQMPRFMQINSKGEIGRIVVRRERTKRQMRKETKRKDYKTKQGEFDRNEIRSVRSLSSKRELPSQFNSPKIPTTFNSLKLRLRISDP